MTPLKLHGHPQKTVYASDAEWPTHEAQGWWPDIDPILAGHLHLAVTFPSYAEITDTVPFWVPFTIKIHNIAGYISALAGYKDIVWDDTGTSTPPVLRGLQVGLVQWSGKMLLDFTPIDMPWLGDIGKANYHGWVAPQWLARVAFDNGDVLTVRLSDCCFLALDTSQPERPASQQGQPGIVHSARANIINAVADRANAGTTTNGTSFGEMVTEHNGRLPLLPITAPWPAIFSVYNYTAGSPLVLGRFEERMDALLHGTPATATTPAIPPNRGTLLDAEDSPSTQGFNNRVMTFDPAVLGPGSHKILTIWQQQAKAGDAEVVRSVLSITVPVGSGTPVPTTCHDPTASNFGGLLPCVYPDPTQPPPVVVPAAQVAVPTLVGLSVPAASAALALVGLTVAGLTSQHDPAPVGSVLTVTPAAGSFVDRGSSVALVTSLGSLVEWKEDVKVTFMQKYVDGVPVAEFQICDTTGKNICLKIVTEPGVETMSGMDGM